ncbi:MAG: hypothetical protein EHM48_01570 [Planctomycetaceae bacterium]|nr:MAG: hypothetical protein EHM48_01570 [Planctomycetaceae bacterium]
MNHPSHQTGISPAMQENQKNDEMGEFQRPALPAAKKAENPPSFGWGTCWQGRSQNIFLPLGNSLLECAKMNVITDCRLRHRGFASPLADMP